MKRVITSSDAILCMSNVRGKYVTQPYSLPFSFYFSSSDGVTHGPRVKPSFNPDKLKMSQTGTLKLCDDWKYIPGRDDTNIGSRDVQEMKSFFRSYIVLFCAVWDELLQDGVVADYFQGRVCFKDLIQDLDFYDAYKEELDDIHDISTLEDFCRNKNLVNMYGN